jgi:acetolactate synthase-1/2/3 large subunit
MNGAESLVRTLLASGIDTCFANPGTSEMHFVAALDRVPGMRCVLGLAEGVVTGCADGYARMAGRPAATLLHCGPGFANGISNLHNARRAHSPVVNIVGDHASYHGAFDPPLAAETETLARAASYWARKVGSVRQVGADAAAAVQAARASPGRIATLILPADFAWNEGGLPEVAMPVPRPSPPAWQVVSKIAKVLRRSEPAVMILAGAALSEAGLLAAARVAAATGCSLRAPTQVSRMARGRGRPAVDRIPYSVDAAIASLSSFKHVILVGAPRPAAFFAYPGKPSLVTPPEATFHELATPEEDLVAALQGLAAEIGVPPEVVRGQTPDSLRGQTPNAKGLGSLTPNAQGAGSLTPNAGGEPGFGDILAHVLPENAIVVDESVSSGRGFFPPTFDAAPHDWLQITGGSIGYGFPCATGAAVASPDRKVVCLQADGGGMYSLQALWTQARCNLDVINVVFANRRYNILQGELKAVGAQPGPASAELFDLSRPNLDWVKLAGGMGVEAVQVTLEGFADVFNAAAKRRGPFLIELLMP